MLHFRMGMPLYLMALYGSVAILVVLLFRGFLKNKLPKFVLPALWILVLVRLLVPFSLSSPLSVPVPEWNLITPEAGTVDVVEGEAVAYTSDAAEYSTAYSESPVFNWTTVLMIAVCIGIAVTAVVLFYQKWRYSQNFRDSLLIEHNETINEILRSMDVGHVLVFTNDHIASPLVSGILNPRIYLPSRMDFQNVQLLRHILTHETMHIKRKDNLIKAIMLLAVCLHWYNPLVWLMSKCLSADVEAACDAAVLKDSDADERQSYAYSLLAMAITGNRQTLLYSAFSKTEVERRIRSVLHYKKVTALVLALSIIFVLGSTMVFATGGQAPFSDYLSSYCGSTNCKWAVKAAITRDIALGDNAQKHANDVILDVMDEDNTNDPDILRNKIVAALTQEFGVEKGAFKLSIYLSLDDQALESEYAAHGITKDKKGLYLYQGESVRSYSDEMLGAVQTRDGGTVDIAVIRDRLGQITSVTALHKGDVAFDQRTREIKWDTSAWTVVPESAARTVEQTTETYIQ